MITMKSIEGDSWLKGKKIVRDPKCTDCDVHFCTAYIESLSENIQKLRFIVNGDPKFDNMP